MTLPWTALTFRIKPSFVIWLCIWSHLTLLSLQWPSFSFLTVFLFVEFRSFSPIAVSLARLPTQRTPYPAPSHFLPSRPLSQESLCCPARQGKIFLRYSLTAPCSFSTEDNRGWIIFLGGEEAAATPVFLPGESAWCATVHGVTESGMTEPLTQQWSLW